MNTIACNTSLSQERSDRFQSILTAMLKRKGVRHAVFSVEEKASNSFWYGAGGTASEGDRPMTLNTPFWIASITKLYIAAIVLRLEEQGLLSVADPASAYLPTGLLDGIHVVDGRDFGSTLTLQQCMSHSTGIPDYLELKGPSGKPFFEEILATEDRSWTLADSLDLVRRTNAPLFAPTAPAKGNARVRYSDTNFQILIGVIEHITQESFGKALHTYLLGPLGLSQTKHPLSEGPLQGGEPADVWAVNQNLRSHPKALASFNDLYATTKDLTRFMWALIEGSAFRQPETAQRMMAYWNTFGFALSPVAPGWPIQYGMGMMRFQVPRWLPPFRSIPAVIGHTGAVGSWLFYCPERNVVTSGTVSQLTAAAAPFQFVPKILQAWTS